MSNNLLIPLVFSLSRLLEHQLACRFYEIHKRKMGGVTSHLAPLLWPLRQLLHQEGRVMQTLAMLLPVQQFLQ